MNQLLGWYFSKYSLEPSLSASPGASVKIDCWVISQTYRIIICEVGVLESSFEQTLQEIHITLLRTTA